MFSTTGLASLTTKLLAAAFVNAVKSVVGIFCCATKSRDVANFGTAGAVATEAGAEAILSAVSITKLLLAMIRAAKMADLS